jgi:hypothetical protein
MENKVSNANPNFELLQVESSLLWSGKVKGVFGSNGEVAHENAHH